MARKKAEKQANPPLRQRTWTDTLRCKLTDDEVAERARRAADKVEERAETEERRKSAAAAYKHELKEIEGEIRECSRAVREREEYRDVTVEEWLRPETGKAETVRLDTGEVIHSRAMTESERQMNLFPLEAGEQAPA